MTTIEQKLALDDLKDILSENDLIVFNESFAGMSRNGNSQWHYSIYLVNDNPLYLTTLTNTFCKAFKYRYTKYGKLSTQDSIYDMRKRLETELGYSVKIQCVS